MSTSSSNGRSPAAPARPARPGNAAKAGTSETTPKRRKAQPPDLIAGGLSPKNQAWLTEQQAKSKRQPPTAAQRLRTLEEQVATLTAQVEGLTAQIVSLNNPMRRAREMREMSMPRGRIGKIR